MIVKVIITDSVNGSLYDISDLVVSMEWTTTLEEQPGKLTFTYIDDKKTFFAEGSKIAATVGNVGLFSGFIFKRERDESSAISITAYDQLRYLQNKDIVNMPIMTCSEVFAKICKEQELVYKVVHSSSYKCAGRVHDNKSYYEMMQAALDDTITSTGDWFFVRDNYGVLEHVKVDQLLTSVIVGDSSLVTGYKFSSDIDSDTYNQVKLTKDNKDTVKREVYIVKDSEAIARWGKLQYYEKMDEKANEAQIKEKANTILELKNRPTRALTLECLGDNRIRAGNGVVLNISDLAGENLPNNQNALVYACTHKFEGDMHTMSLELEVI